jgi:hypothetical protein
MLYDTPINDTVTGLYRTEPKRIICPKCKYEYENDINWQPIRMSGKRVRVCYNCFAQDLKFRVAKRNVKNTRLKVVKNLCRH